MSHRDRIPDLLLEQLHLGELGDRRLEALRAEFGQDALDRALRELAASDEAVQARLPSAEAFARRVHARRRKRALPKGEIWLWVAPGVAAAAAVLALAVQGPGSPGRPSPSGHGNQTSTHGDRIKGLRPRLLAYRKSGDAAERLAPGATARAGDVIQLAYVAAGHAHGVICSLDGNGVVTLHLPRKPGQRAVLEPSGETPLTDAYELDDAPSFERFFFVTAATPIDANDVLEAVRALSGEPNPESRPLVLSDRSVASFVLYKESL